MTTIALSIWFTLFALINLGAKIPTWTLGVAAIFVVIVLVLSGGWRRPPKATVIAILLLPALLLTGCTGLGTISKTAKELKNQTTIVRANTPWGPQLLLALNTNTTVIMSPDGSMSINPPFVPTTTPTPTASEALTIVPVTRLETFRSGQTGPAGSPGQKLPAKKRP